MVTLTALRDPAAKAVSPTTTVSATTNRHRAGCAVASVGRVNCEAAMTRLWPRSLRRKSAIHLARCDSPLLPTTTASEHTNRRREATSAARASCIAAVAGLLAAQPRRRGTRLLAPRLSDSTLGTASSTSAIAADSRLLPQPMRTCFRLQQRHAGTSHCRLQPPPPLATGGSPPPHAPLHAQTSSPHAMAPHWPCIRAASCQSPPSCPRRTRW